MARKKKIPAGVDPAYLDKQKALLLRKNQIGRASCRERVSSVV